MGKVNFVSQIDSTFSTKNAKSVSFGSLGFSNPRLTGPIFNNPNGIADEEPEKLQRRITELRWSFPPFPGVREPQATFQNALGVTHQYTTVDLLASAALEKTNPCQSVQ